MPGTVVGCHLLCSGFSLARGVVLQLFVQTYHRLLSAFGTSITNAYSAHFVKSSSLNAKAKFLSFFVFHKAALNVGLVPPIFYFAERVWMELWWALSELKGWIRVLIPSWGSWQAKQLWVLVKVKVLSCLIKAWSIFSRGIGVVIYAIDVPFCLGNRFGSKVVQPVFVVRQYSMKNLKVLGKWRLCIVSEEYFCISKLFRWYGTYLRNYASADTCGRAKREDVCKNSIIKSGTFFRLSN